MDLLKACFMLAVTLLLVFTLVLVFSIPEKKIQQDKGFSPNSIVVKLHC